MTRHYRLVVEVSDTLRYLILPFERSDTGSAPIARQPDGREVPRSRSPAFAMAHSCHLASIDAFRTPMSARADALVLGPGSPAIHSPTQFTHPARPTALQSSRCEDVQLSHGAVEEPRYPSLPVQAARP